MPSPHTVPDLDTPRTLDGQALALWEEGLLGGKRGSSACRGRGAIMLTPQRPGQPPRRGFPIRHLQTRSGALVLGKQLPSPRPVPQATHRSSFPFFNTCFWKGQSELDVPANTCFSFPS